MQRREFIKLFGLSVGSIVLYNPLLGGVSKLLETYPTDELIGKKRPQFYGDNYNLRKKASESFDKMRKEARKAGIEIYSQSSYRSYYRQRDIWNRKYDRYKNQGLSEAKIIEKIIAYSTFPGTSRHHWGTDLDIIDKNVPNPGDVLNAKHFKKGGAFEKLHFWMQENAHKYGFYMTYTNTVGRKGFNYEPWHWSFQETSKEMLQAYLKLDHKKVLTTTQVKGSSYFMKNNWEKYLTENLKDINPKLLP